MTRAALALGANLNSPRDTLLSAQVALLARPASPLRLLAASPLYATEPVEGPSQPWFLNQVLLVEGAFSAEMLLLLARAVERAHGRSRAVPKGPRILDVDLLFVDGAILCTKRLTLPHPALHRRRCVLAPLCDVAPEWRHPRLGATAKELLARCPLPGRVLRLGPG